MNENPEISILCCSYNHEKYIEQTIKSILNQTFQNFEIIVVDDHSNDNTLSVLQQFNDTRLKIFTKEFNQGINNSINMALKNVKGEYIVFFGTDDVMEPDFLELIHKTFLETQTDVIYSPLKIIDCEGNLKKEKGKIEIIKLPVDKTKYEILNEMFLKNNCLTSPGMAVRTKVFKKYMPYDEGIINNQDYYIHVNLLLENNIYILNEAKILYRHDDKHKSLSSDNDSSRLIQEVAECPRVMDCFLKTDDIELLKKIFPEDKDLFKHKELIQFYFGKQAIKSKSIHRQLWGYRTIMNFISDNDNFKLLYKLEKFNFADYLLLKKRFNISNPFEYPKYQKYKKLYKILLKYSVISTILIIISIILLINKFI